MNVALVALTASWGIAEAILAPMATTRRTNGVGTIEGHVTLTTEAEIRCDTGAVYTSRRTGGLTVRDAAIHMVKSHVASTMFRLKAQTIAAAAAADGITAIGMIHACHVAGVASTLVGRHTVAVFALLLTDGHTLSQAIVALVAHVALTFLRRHTVSVGTINAAKGLTNALTTVPELIAL